MLYTKKGKESMPLMNVCYMLYLQLIKKNYEILFEVVFLGLSVYSYIIIININKPTKMSTK